MKIRVKFNNDKFLIQTGEDVNTVNELKNLIANEIQGLPTRFSLSLNGISALDDDADEKLIKDVGIVSGDLLHIVSASASFAGTPRQVEHPSASLNNSKPTNAGVWKAEDFLKLFPAHNETDRPREEVKMDVCSSEHGELCTTDEDVMMMMSFREITKRFERMPRSPQECLVVAVHFLMNELGFRAVGGVEEGSDDDTVEMKFIHMTFNQMTFHVLIITMMNKCILHGLSKESGKITQRDSVNIDPTQFFDKSRDLEYPMYSKDIIKPDRLVILRKMFRDQIINNMKQCALRVHGFPEMAGLLTIPYHIQLKILNLLDVPSLLRLSETCSLWHSLSRDHLVWKRKYQQHFKQGSAAEDANNDGTLPVDWLARYREEYIKLCKQKRFRDVYTRPPPMMTTIYPPRPHFPLDFPGIIGGYYDLYPGGMPDILDRSSFRRQNRSPHFPGRGHFGFF